MPFDVPTAFDPAHKSALVALSPDGRMMTRAGVAAGGASTRTIGKNSTGKWHAEFVRTSIADWMFGPCGSTTTTAQFPGETSNGVGLYRGDVYVNNAVVESVAGLNAAGTFAVELDLVARTVRIFNASATSSTISLPFSGDVYLAGWCGIGYTGGLKINTGQEAFSLAVSSGFTPGFPRSAFGIAGAVEDAAGAPDARTVRAYRRDTGALAGEVVSDGTTGDYLLIPEPNTTDPHTVVFLPPDDSENAIVYDWVEPV